MSLITFSRPTARLLKEELPKIEQLIWADENTLDLTSIKQLKGCRTGLISDCLKCIQELEDLNKISVTNTNGKKNAIIEPRESLVEGLKKYLSSCERYPRTKDFLNIVPDNISGMVLFTMIVSTFIATSFPPVAIIPVSILIGVLMDFFFNNREAAKALRQVLFTAKDELITIKKAFDLFSGSHQNPSETEETEETALLATPSASINYDSLAGISLPSCSHTCLHGFFSSADNMPKSNSINSDSSSTLDTRISI